MSAPGTLFIPENALEQRLVAATHDPAARPDFYRELVRSDIFVINARPDPAPAGRRIVEEGATLALMPVEVNGRSFLPIFSSLQRLQSAVREPVSYLAMNALEFMKITSGADLLLNYGSAYGKELLAAEVASIVDGTIFRPAERYVVQEETPILIGQPTVPPVELLDVLRRLFRRMPSVAAAYSALYVNRARSEQPLTLIAIDAPDDASWDGVVADAGLACNGVTVPNPPVDFIRLGSGSGVDDYFRRDAKPFFTRGSGPA